MDQEVFNTFKDQFAQDCITLDNLLATIEIDIPAQDAINAFFRIVHNLKASTQFLKLTPILKLSQKVEVILNTMRGEGKITTQTELDWLKIVCHQYHVWSDELDLGVVELAEVNPQIEKLMRHQDKRESANAILQKLHVLYIDDEPQTIQMMQKLVKPLFATLTWAKEITAIEAAIVDKPDIIFIGEHFLENQCEVVSLLTQHNELVPIVALANEVHNKQRMLWLQKGIHYFLVRPVQSGALKKVLFSIINTHFTQRKMIITNQKIQTFIDQLEPLSQTLLDIQNVCDDEHSSVSDLIKVIKQDPVTSGIILNATKSPMYAFKSITSIDQAVSIFGKRTIKALTLNGLKSTLGKIDLHPYQINEAIFSNIAQLRMALMQNWYTKVNKEHLPKLLISALLGNIGQILIAKEIIANQKSDEFTHMLKTAKSKEVEYNFLHTTTSAVTSDILYFWKISSDVIDSISYADDPFDAVEEIFPLAVANHVVYSLVPNTEDVIQPISPRLRKVLDKAGLKIDILEEAINKTKEMRNF